jgi:capsular polysaccharide biosynthesis protein
MRTSSTSKRILKDGCYMTVVVVFAAGIVVFGALSYVMVRQYLDNMSTEDDDIEIYGGDRTKIRHEAGI